jgi:hypothetical protein
LPQYNKQVTQSVGELRSLAIGVSQLTRLLIGRVKITSTKLC